MNEDNSPLVTVVIPAYNHERYVVDGIRSIINEKIASLTEECTRRFARFEYIDRVNVGLSATLNQALSIARGTYFSVLASDDIAYPNKIDTLVYALEANGAAFAAAFGNAQFIDENGRTISMVKSGRFSGGDNNEEVDNCLDYYSTSRKFTYTGAEFGSYKTLIAGNYLPSMSNVVRTAAISEVGGWTPGNVMEDWEMWLKLARKRKFLLVDEPLAFYRWHDLNTAKTMANGLVDASLLVLNGERAFCVQNNLLSYWNATHDKLVFQLLRKKGVPFSKKLSLLMGTNKASLVKSAVRRLMRISG